MLPPWAWSLSPTSTAGSQLAQGLDTHEVAYRVPAEAADWLCFWMSRLPIAVPGLSTLFVHDSSDIIVDLLLVKLCLRLHPAALTSVAR